MLPEIARAGHPHHNRHLEQFSSANRGCRREDNPMSVSYRLQTILPDECRTIRQPVSSYALSGQTGVWEDRSNVSPVRNVNSLVLPGGEVKSGSLVVEK